MSAEVTDETTRTNGVVKTNEVKPDEMASVLVLPKEKPFITGSDHFGDYRCYESSGNIEWGLFNPVTKDGVIHFQSGNWYQGELKEIEGSVVAEGKGFLSSSNKTVSGNFKNNLEHGACTVFIKNKGKLSGNFDNGELVGRSSFVSKDGSIQLSGELKLTEQGSIMPNGFCVRSDAEARYTGYFSSAMYSGLGCLKFLSGEIYRGSFRAGLKHGKGEYFFLSGDVYSGYFRDDEIHGTGKMAFHNGDVYEGEFAHGVIHGRGVFSWKKAEEDEITLGKRKRVEDVREKDFWLRFEGFFSEGEIGARGTIHFSDGSAFSGDFSKGRPAKGVFHYSTGGNIEVEYNDDGELVPPNVGRLMLEHAKLRERVEELEAKQSESFLHFFTAFSPLAKKVVLNGNSVHDETRKLKTITLNIQTDSDINLPPISAHYTLRSADVLRGTGRGHIETNQTTAELINKKELSDVNQEEDEVQNKVKMINNLDKEWIKHKQVILLNLAKYGKLR
eukprot:maker-scaffold_20-snap-gene-5.8-mRNA-1 protein AED:0.00 eAED:0.00 QI:151/1/1/1/1/1/2/166/501